MINKFNIIQVKSVKMKMKEKMGNNKVKRMIVIMKWKTVGIKKEINKLRKKKHILF